MEIKAKEIVLVSVEDLIPHPKNPNVHSKDQIKRLCEIIEYQGFRRPLTVSHQSNYLIVGHGRLMAAKKLGMKKVPVVYQDYLNDDMEFADLVADNAIDDWAVLDLAHINFEVQNLGPDFKIDLLGIKDFVMDMSDKKFNPSDSSNEKPHKVCSNCGEPI